MPRVATTALDPRCSRFAHLRFRPPTATRHSPAGPNGAIRNQVAGYLAKYATKSTEATGLVAYKITGDTIDAYAGRETHPGRLIDACWRLGHPQTGGDWGRLRRWARMLCFGGHFSTRSGRYSTTLKALREARRTWRRNAVTGAELAAATRSGERTTADAELAAMAADSARARRLLGYGEE